VKVAGKAWKAREKKKPKEFKKIELQRLKEHPNASGDQI